MLPSENSEQQSTSQSGVVISEPFYSETQQYNPIKKPKNKKRLITIISTSVLIILAAAGFLVSKINKPNNSQKPLVTALTSMQATVGEGKPVYNSYQLFQQPKGKEAATLTLLDDKGKVIRTDEVPIKIEVNAVLGDGLFWVYTKSTKIEATAVDYLYDQNGLHELSSVVKNSTLVKAKDYKQKQIYVYNDTSVIFERCQGNQQTGQVTCQTYIVDLITGADKNIDNAALKDYTSRLVGINPNKKSVYYLGVVTKSWNEYLAKLFSQDNRPTIPQHEVMQVDIATGKLLSSTKINTSWPSIGNENGPSVSPNGRYIIYQGGDNKLHCINVLTNNNEVVKMPADTWGVNALSRQNTLQDPLFSPDGNKVIFGSSEKTTQHVVMIDLTSKKSFGIDNGQLAIADYDSFYWVDDTKLRFSTHVSHTPIGNFEFDLNNNKLTEIQNTPGKLMGIADGN